MKDRQKKTRLQVSSSVSAMSFDTNIKNNMSMEIYKIRKYGCLVILILLFFVACNTEKSQVSEPLLINSPTVTPILITPSPAPTILVFITPDTDQLASWQVYERALAKNVYPPGLGITDVLCEWEILDQLEEKIYVWVVCSGYYSPHQSSTASLPAIIYLDINGDIQGVETTENTPGSYSDTLRELFPMDIQEKFQYYRFGGAKIMRTHIDIRRFSQNPPLFVLSATPPP